MENTLLCTPNINNSTWLCPSWVLLTHTHRLDAALNNSIRVDYIIDTNFHATSCQRDNASWHPQKQAIPCPLPPCWSRQPAHATQHRDSEHTRAKATAIPPSFFRATQATDKIRSMKDQHVIEVGRRDLGNEIGHHTLLLTSLTLVELFGHRRRVNRQSDVSPWPSCLRLSSGFPSPCTISVHHLPSDFVAFPSVVVLLGGSQVLYSGEPLVSSLDVWPPHDLVSCCSAGCMFSRRLISSFLILSILAFPAAFLRHLISDVVTTCLSLLMRVRGLLW